ncbi:hypothetical protein PVAP13_8NG203101 [Panicum virgatum]|uniref:Uncharacterized protein n=1 Tax=Panicum virgatum TaxID=38727 RepID=A0A8T0P4G6_PANVG|nr:hypothetical protein PVAP13_8NG203101 [Panicum virgatum]
MKTSSDFSRQFVVIWSFGHLNLSTGSLSSTTDAMCNLSLFLQQVSGNVIDIEFYYLLLLVHSPIRTVTEGYFTISAQFSWRDRRIEALLLRPCLVYSTNLSMQYGVDCCSVEF